MSATEQPPEDHPQDAGGLDWKTLLPLASLAVSVLVLLVALVLAIQLAGLSDDIAALRKQTKAMLRTTQSIGDDIAAMNARNASPPHDSGAAAKRSTASSEPAAPTHMDAADPRQDCVIRPGKGDGLANCLKDGAGKSAH